MTDTVYIVLAAALGAFVVLGAVYRVTPPDVWPPGLKQVAAASWYVASAVLGVMAALAWTSPDKADESSDVANTPDPTTAADDADAETESVEQSERNPSMGELADDLDELGDR